MSPQSRLPQGFTRRAGLGQGDKEIWEKIDVRLHKFYLAWHYNWGKKVLRLKEGWGGPVVQQLSLHVPLQRPGVCWFRSQVQTWYRLASHAVAGIPRIKWRKMGMDVSSGPVFLSKKGRIGSRC